MPLVLKSHFSLCLLDVFPELELSQLIDILVEKIRSDNSLSLIHSLNVICTHILPILLQKALKQVEDEVDSSLNLLLGFPFFEGAIYAMFHTRIVLWKLVH